MPVAVIGDKATTGDIDVPLSPLVIADEVPDGEHSMRRCLMLSVFVVYIRPVMFVEAFVVVVRMPCLAVALRGPLKIRRIG